LKSTLADPSGCAVRGELRAGRLLPQGAVARGRTLSSESVPGGLNVRELSSPSISASPTPSNLASSSRHELRTNFASCVSRHLLVLSSDAGIRNACSALAHELFLTVVEAGSLSDTEAVPGRPEMDVVLLDLDSSRNSEILEVHQEAATCGLPLLAELRALQPNAEIIVISSATKISDAVSLMRGGARDYLEKPFALADLARALRRASEASDARSVMLARRKSIQRGAREDRIVGQSSEMQTLRRILSKVGMATHPVLLQGESGTGKELFARTIHRNGPNAKNPFVVVDCKSLLPELKGGELFGSIEGGIPEEVGKGRPTRKVGLLTLAAGGTVLLDGVEALSLDVQAKLIRAWQERAVRPTGGSSTIPLSCRFLASSTVDLQALVQQGRFRRDLFYRLSVVTLRLPGLRNRTEDIPELSRYFLDRERSKGGTLVLLADEVLRLMLAYPWPGNVRELETVIVRLCRLSSGPIGTVADLPSPLLQFRAAMEASSQQLGQVSASGDGKHLFISSLGEIEKRAILDTIQQLQGDKLQAAKILGIGKTTLYRKLKQYGFEESVGMSRSC